MTFLWIKVKFKIKGEFIINERQGLWYLSLLVCCVMLYALLCWASGDDEQNPKDALNSGVNCNKSPSSILDENSL